MIEGILKSASTAGGVWSISSFWSPSPSYWLDSWSVCLTLKGPADFFETAWMGGPGSGRQDAKWVAPFDGDGTLSSKSLPVKGSLYKETCSVISNWDFWVLYNLKLQRCSFYQQLTRASSHATGYKSVVCRPIVLELKLQIARNPHIRLSIYPVWGGSDKLEKSTPLTNRGVSRYDCKEYWFLLICHFRGGDFPF